MDYRGKTIKSLVNVSEDERTANMQLYGVIGEAIDGNLFAQELAMLGEFGFDQVMININSVGGSIVHGFSVLNAMNALRVNGTKVGTYVVGVADSMASIILAFGDRGNRSAASFSSGIIHEPRIDQNGKQVLIDDLPEGQLKDELSQMRDSLVNAMASSIGSSKAEVKKLMKAGDIRRTAKELKSLGLVDNVVQLTNEVDIKNKTGVELMAACSNISPSKPKTMSRVNKLLGLNAEASEDAQVQAIEKLMNKAQDAENKIGDVAKKDKEITDLKAEVKTYKDQAAAANKAAVESFVDQQIEAGKFQEDKREELVAQAEKDFDGFKAFTGSMTESFFDVNKEIQNAGSAGSGSAPADAMLAQAKEYFKHDSEGTLEEFKNKVGDKKFAAIEEYYSDNLDKVLDD